jgi:hypothetical protein
VSDLANYASVQAMRAAEQVGYGAPEETFHLTLDSNDDPFEMNMEKTKTTPRDPSLLKTEEELLENAAEADAWKGNHGFVLLTSFVDGIDESGIVWAV